MNATSLRAPGARRSLRECGHLAESADTTCPATFHVRRTLRFRRILRICGRFASDAHFEIAITLFSATLRICEHFMFGERFEFANAFAFGAHFESADISCPVTLRICELFEFALTSRVRTLCVRRTPDGHCELFEFGIASSCV